MWIMVNNNQEKSFVHTLSFLGCFWVGWNGESCCFDAGHDTRQCGLSGASLGLSASFEELCVRWCLLRDQAFECRGVDATLFLTVGVLRMEVF